jgi:hypothetical protein
MFASASISTSERFIGQFGREMLLEAILVDDDVQVEITAESIGQSGRGLLLEAILVEDAAFSHVVPSDIPRAGVLVVEDAAFAHVVPSDIPRAGVLVFDRDVSILRAFPNFNTTQSVPLQALVQLVVELDTRNDPEVRENLEQEQNVRKDFCCELLRRREGYWTEARDIHTKMGSFRHNVRLKFSGSRKRIDRDLRLRVSRLELQQRAVHRDINKVLAETQSCELALRDFLDKAEYDKQRGSLLEDLTALCGTRFLELIWDEYEACKIALSLDLKSLGRMRSALRLSPGAVLQGQVREFNISQLQKCCEAVFVADRFPELREVWTDPAFLAGSLRQRTRCVAKMIEERIPVLETSREHREREKIRIGKELRLEQERVFVILKGIFML